MLYEIHIVFFVIDGPDQRRERFAVYYLGYAPVERLEHRPPDAALKPAAISRRRIGYQHIAFEYAQHISYSYVLDWFSKRITARSALYRPDEACPP